MGPDPVAAVPVGRPHLFPARRIAVGGAQQAAALDHDPVVEEAISTVFEATGDEGGFTRVWVVSPERAGRLWRRAALPRTRITIRSPTHDQHGQLNLPNETALRFARAFAGAAR